MFELEWYQYLLIGCTFIWSGFVRSGLGFGGAALSLPFLLLILNQPLVFLPVIAIHLLFFSSLTIYQSHRKSTRNPNDGSLTGGIDWLYIRYTMGVMFVPLMIGVFGLITLPPELMSGIIFIIVLIYSIGYIINRPFKSQGKSVDLFLLVLGGYVSGASLIGAPLIIAVYANHVNKHQLRDTLFAVWFILVTIKMAAFIYADVDLQLIHQLWLLPCAALGHVIGLRFHERLLHGESSRFYRVLGGGLLIVSCIGLFRSLMELI